MISTVIDVEKSAVQVTADNGNVVQPSKVNAKWGYIRVKQTRVVVDEQGFGRLQPVSALIHGLVKDLNRFGWKKDQALKGTIIFKEQLIPFNKKEPSRDYKIAGKSGIVCCIDGSPIYRKTFYTSDPNAQDVFILDENGNRVYHTNGDEIRLAYQDLADRGVQLEDNTPIDNL